jgi:hypothetical protein
MSSTLWDSCKLSLASDIRKPFGCSLASLETSKFLLYFSGRVVSLNRPFLSMTFSVITSQLHCFQLRTTLNGIDFKFVSHRLLPQEGPWPLSLVFVFKLISTFIGQNPKLFFMHVLKKDILLLWPYSIAHEKQTWNPCHLRWSYKVVNSVSRDVITWKIYSQQSRCRRYLHWHRSFEIDK